MKKLLITAVLALFAMTQTFAQKEASIEFEKTTLDFGDVKPDQDILKGTFVFKNVGKSPLVVLQVLTSCGCTVATYTKEPVAPGKTGKVEVTYDTRRGGKSPGKFKKTITVATNGVPEKPRLVICGNMVAK
ncbi:MAG: DUF1573 domain-containing protein [Bacteroidaceae bacterium]|nr:DUF1573 domain-containing protein [Bacteroidaceae bacterium]